MNVSSVPQLSVFRYPGGKTWFVPAARQWVKSIHGVDTFIEPFAGGGIVGLVMAKEQLARRVILADLDPNVSSVWNTILDSVDYETLSDRILRFQMDPNDLGATWERINEAKAIGFAEGSSTLDRAFATILANRTNYGGIIASGGGKLKSGEGGKGPLSRWYPSTLAERIHVIQALSGCITYCQANAFSLLNLYADVPDVALLLDPPYTVGKKSAGSRLYAFNEVDHEELFRVSSDGFQNVLFTYPDDPAVMSLAYQYQLDTRKIPMRNTKHTLMEELLVSKDFTWLDTPSV